MTDIRRTILWVVFVTSLFLLWDAWNKHNGQPSLFGGPPPRSATASSAPGGAASAAVPAPAATAQGPAGAVPRAPPPPAQRSQERNAAAYESVFSFFSWAFYGI